MSHPVRHVGERSTVAEAARIMRDLDVGAVPVCDGQHRLVGVITDRDIALRVAAEGCDSAATEVKDVMTRDPIACDVDSRLSDVAGVMEKFQIRRVPIVDSSDKVVGLVTLDDLLALLSEEMADMGKGIAGALFRRPSQSEPAETAMPLNWIICYL